MLHNVDPEALSARIAQEIKHADSEDAEPAARGVQLISASTVTIGPIDWLWDGYLAAGKVHILAGAPGTGKTTIALALAATLTIAGSWPDGTSATGGSVLIWSGEDDPADVLVPRLAAMGANLSRVQFIGDTTKVFGSKSVSHAFNPASDMDALAERIAADPPALLIVDPIVAAVSGDSHKNTEVRRALQPLVDLARMHHVAVLGITHLSKGTQDRDPVERVTGSVAFGALARVVLFAAKAQSADGGERRVFMRGKSNIGTDIGGFEYSLEQRSVPAHPNVFASCVVWGPRIEGSARDVLTDAEAPPSNDDRTGTDEAREFLLDALQDGPVPVKDLHKQATDAGVSKKCLRRAQAQLGVAKKKNGMKGGWVWELPPKMPSENEDAPLPCSADEGIFGDEGRLRESDAGDSDAAAKDSAPF